MAPILTMSFKSIVHVDIIKNHLASLLIAIRNCIRYIGLKSEWNTNAIFGQIDPFPECTCVLVSILNWDEYQVSKSWLLYIFLYMYRFILSTHYIMAAILTKSFNSIIVHVDIVFCTKYTLELQNGYQNTHAYAKVRNVLHVHAYISREQILTAPELRPVA